MQTATPEQISLLQHRLEDSSHRLKTITALPDVPHSTGTPHTKPLIFKTTLTGKRLKVLFHK